jgi:Transposase DDE domain group 1
VKACRWAWPKVQITVVMDAAFNDPKIYDWCEDNNVFYLIKLKAAGKPGGGLYGSSNELARQVRIAFVKKHGQPQYQNTDTTKNSVETGIRKLEKKERKEKLKELNSRVVRRYGQFEHRTGKGGKDPKQWRQDRRVLAVCVFDDWGDHRSFWVTNIVGYLPQYLIEVVYSSRGKAELFIKDAKAFRCDKLSCEDFFANQCRLLVQVLAYQLMYRLRSLLPKSMQSMSLASVRDYFIRIPVIVKEKAKTVDLAWSRTFPFKIQMHALLGRLTSQQQKKLDWVIEWQQRLTPIIVSRALKAA